MSIESSFRATRSNLYYTSLHSIYINTTLTKRFHVIHVYNENKKVYSWLLWTERNNQLKSWMIVCIHTQHARSCSARHAAVIIHYEDIKYDLSVTALRSKGRKLVLVVLVVEWPVMVDKTTFATPPSSTVQAVDLASPLQQPDRRSTCTVATLPFSAWSTGPIASGGWCLTRAISHTRNRSGNDSTTCLRWVESQRKIINTQQLF